MRAPLPSASQAKAAKEEPEEEVLELGVEGDWGNLFDAGDEAVRLDLKKPRP